MKLGIHMTREERLAVYRNQLAQKPTAALEVLEAELGTGLFWDAVGAELAERRGSAPDPGPCAACGDAGFVEDAEDGTREPCPECGRAEGGHERTLPPLCRSRHPPPL